jgi:hypothetical protein
MTMKLNPTHLPGWLEGILVVALAVSTVLGAVSLPVIAQEESEEPETEEESLPPVVSADALLEDEEFMLSGEGYDYDPGDRRDPFKSLLVVREASAARGPRPEGVPGLLIDEIDLSGIFITPSGPVAQVQSTQGDKSHLLHEGDQLYDGDVVSIGPAEVVFKKIVDDPTAVKPFREVVKKLNP